MKKALDAGINVIQVNLKSPNNGDAYVGANGTRSARKRASSSSRCAAPAPARTARSRSFRANPTTADRQIAIPGFEDESKKHPEMQIVANQSADWDATKAHEITGTILKQNPDLCGIIGFWDVQDVGTAAAIKEAGKTGKVQLIS